MHGYRKGTVESADGTVIGYREIGEGPAVILLHGGMLAAQHMMTLAEILADTFTVCVPDRRGRGLSGPHGERFGVERETEDVAALAATTGAARIFGLSSGALVALRAALHLPGLTRVALYEPPLSSGGSTPLGWTNRYEREIAAGKRGAAMITALKGLRVEPSLARIPRSVLGVLIPLALRAQGGAGVDDVAVDDLIPTLHYDIQIVRETAETAAEYAKVDAPVLLMGGSKSPDYLRTALDALETTLPHAERVTLARMGHDGPTDDGSPARVGAILRDFFGPSASRG
ncbi:MULTISPECIES: alpha/beta fold hydrolase [Glycomyces]|uniref:Alpha/beta hydrolase n=2 Tax=Glycomyces TaxID=58113 RepID=A0A9X3PGV5_9ACTN|nr:alpha/beta hydrolase [Glycomyces lechevalierae]MDA1385090.1 alpha/beta hydrolase [Glycomyces lechevalierae]MDR7337296.1 pimeloyl-ACP methyl ester carboxylesterase [Glycomyces lechevalierae]